MPSTSVHLNTVSGLGAIVLWSATVALVGSLSKQLGPIKAAMATYLIGAFFCGLHLAFSPTPLKSVLQLSRLYVFGCGGLFVFYTVVLYVALGFAKDDHQLLEIGMVNYLWPVLSVFGSLLLLRQRANWLVWPGMGLALLGIFLVMTQRGTFTWHSFWEHVQTNPVAYLLALAGAVLWALYSNLARLWSTPGSHGAVEWFIIATGLVLLVVDLFIKKRTVWNSKAMGEAVALALFTAVAYYLWDLSIRKGEIKTVLVCSYFTPLLSTLVTCLYLGISSGLKLWGGCVVLVLGSLMTWYSVAKP